MTHVRLVLLYSTFAALATGVNLLCQYAVLSSWDDRRAVLLALVVGTIAGMPVKYVLDKRYIFRFSTERLSDETRMFATYVVFAGVTTVIFWGCELLAGLIHPSNAAHLIGGAIGLAIGYTMKYRMDRAWVFVERSPR